MCRVVCGSKFLVVARGSRFVLSVRGPVPLSRIPGLAFVSCTLHDLLAYVELAYRFGTNGDDWVLRQQNTKVEV